MSSGKAARPVATPSVTRQLMQTHAVSAKKSLGQNFIIEPQVIADIVAAAGCDKQDLVLEIGPGLGSLTQSLSAAAGQVLALEIDQSLLAALAESLAACSNVRLLHADALEADLTGLLAEFAGREDLTSAMMLSTISSVSSALFALDGSMAIITWESPTSSPKVPILLTELPLVSTVAIRSRAMEMPLPFQYPMGSTRQVFSISAGSVVRLPSVS